MGEKVEIPSPEEQKEILIMKLSKSVVNGDIWYLVDSKWMKSLKQFIGIDKWESSSVAFPGPIDNSRLLDDQKKDIKKALVEYIDYELVPEDGWRDLITWYGLLDGQKPIPRKAVEVGSNISHHTMVEVYPLELKCVKNFNFQTEIKLKASKAELISDIDIKLRSIFRIPRETSTRMWLFFHAEKYELLDMANTVQTSGLNDYQHVILETQNLDGSWNKPVKQANKTASYANMYSIPSTSGGASSSVAPLTSPRSSRQMSTSTAHTPKQPGLCGLINLGNTCFMNSVIQCMSNCPPITEYFLSGRHLMELNEANPLGMKGEIAKAYGELIEVMWCGKNAFTIPQRFKIQVGIFNPTFCGCQQHDSQELLTFLLDGLHEDLNRIISKPYMVVEDCTGRDDTVVAQETWENYRKRNDSIIVDTFHGLLKSRVICPQCERLSVTFDPFCYLSLPLPLKKDRNVMVRYIPYEGNICEQMFRVTVPKKGIVKDLCMEMQMYTTGNPEHMLVAEITYCHFHRFFGNDDMLDSIEDKDVIYIFQLSVVPNPRDTHNLVFPVCFWEVSLPTEEFNQKQIFGIPFILVLPHEPILIEDLHEEIFRKMGRHFDYTKSKRVLQNGDDNMEVVEDNCNNGKTFFKLFVIDTALYSSPRVLNADGNYYDLPGLFRGQEPEKCFGRLALLLQFTSDQRREYYHEKPPRQLVCNSINKERSRVTIQDCLRLFTTCEKLSADDAWYCPVCKEHQRATKKFDLWKLPKILIIHLKRFQYTRFRRDKIDTLVEFPVSNLNMSEYVISSDAEILYDLVSVCNHYGNMGGGHYTAYCKNKDTMKWYCFDDNSVSPISEDSIMTSAAYVLFYMAKDKLDDNLDLDLMDVN